MSKTPNLWLVCPSCGQTLTTYIKTIEPNKANWVLTPGSQEHLDKGLCVPQAPKVKKEDGWEPAARHYRDLEVGLHD